ncbi:MAG: hypothetical protein V4627_13420 [Pseudomonadota bacterium]
MAISTINRFISLFDTAFRALPTTVSMADTERLAMLVHHAMESTKRVYHKSGHVFGLCEGMGPVQVLAALFHDLVYYQLDQGFPPHARYWLRDVTREVGDTLVLQPIPPDDAELALCAALFDFAPDQVLPLYGGMNEFLSAVVAARLLQPHVGTSELIAIVACIEATIPFRAPDSQGKTAADRLAQRVMQAYLDRVDGSDPVAAQAFADRVVRDAVTLTNRDVGSFSEADPGLFLSSTWLLIEESNAPLAVAGMYTVQEYRLGLSRMEGFLRTLDPHHVFHQYKGQPSAREFADMQATAHNNIVFATDFLGSKIASIAIVEALALCTGTDGPIAMFLGEIRSAYGRPERVEDYLPPVPPKADVNPELLAAFEKGRTLESNNDLTASPITAFVYRYIGRQGTQDALALAREMFDGQRTPLAFLQALDRVMVGAIVRACAQIALSRRQALQELAQSL